ncbi:farnesol dehydrogenase-like [Euwallacea similis]|uniref:farnesol dehydrogenase-like n=1 Tax=Euwallacea similis TaxID=1736056 RepID=UPI00344C0956
MSYSLSLTRFTGKLAVVTGASYGIGEEIVRTLVKNGINVAGIARSVDKVQEIAKQLSNEKGKLHAFKGDLTKQEDILSVFNEIDKKLGPIHVLINNAAVFPTTDIIDGDIEKWKSVLDTNVLAVAICIREAVKSMKNSNVKGQIININSTFGHRIYDVKGFQLYGASKFALTALTETVRLEINREKLPIQITSLSPGLVKTEGIKQTFGEEVVALLPRDIAEAVLYVLSTPEHVNVKELTIVSKGEN